MGRKAKGPTGPSTPSFSPKRRPDSWADIQTLLAQGSSQLGLSLTDPQLFQLITHLQELRRWGERLDLTGYRSDQARAIHLTLDSMLLVPLLPPAGGSLLDIGSGGGFPGVVLKILIPRLRVTLIEANRRRGNFLRHLGRQLHLDDFEILVARAETVHRDFSSRFEAVTLRALGPPNVAIELGAPFLRSRGILLLSLSPASVLPQLPPNWSQELFSIPLPRSSVKRRILRITKPPKEEEQD